MKTTHTRHWLDLKTSERKTRKFFNVLEDISNHKRGLCSLWGHPVMCYYCVITVLLHIYYDSHRNFLRLMHYFFYLLYVTTIILYTKPQCKKVLILSLCFSFRKTRLKFCQRKMATYSVTLSWMSTTFYRYYDLNVRQMTVSEN